MFDWNVYPDSRISKIRSPYVRKCALMIRNMGNRYKRAFITNPYSKLIARKYHEAVELAVYYVMSADIGGDIAEFGTHGGTAAVICNQLAFYKPKINLHMFDSFEGFPEATASEDVTSPHVLSGIWPKGGSAPRISAATLRKRLQRRLPRQQIKIYEGWYKDTLPTISDNTKFAMLLLDCCLYQSHHEALTYLFGHKMVNDGAIVLFSDWNANTASPNFGSRKAWEKAVADFSIVYSNAGTYCWGGQKFIIHSYKR